MDASEVRSKLLGRASKPEPFDCGGGVTVFIKKPTVAQRTRILREAGVKGDDTSNLDQNKFQVAVATELLVDDAGKALFGKADTDALVAVETGDWLDKVTKRVQQMLTGQDVEQGKASAGTPSAS